MTDTELLHPNFDLGEFRYAVAQYAKLLIRARWRCEPGFLDQERLSAWGLENIGRDRWPPWQLLDQAAAALGYLNQHFLPRCGSGGVSVTDEETPAARLVLNVALLAVMDGTGPHHNGALFNAAHRLRDGKAVNWNALAEWNLLDGIRADLDLLPHPGHADASPRMERIEELLHSLIESEQTREFYSLEEVARILERAVWTVREWCRLGRVQAEKKRSGRGRAQEWVISHAELQRIRKEGLLPLRKY